MNKYPVTSTRGNEYYVEVFECSYDVNHYEVGVYQIHKGWFNRDKYHLCNKGFMGDLRSYDFDIVLMVSTIIENMEDKWEQQALHKKQLTTSRNNFSEWDGKIIKEDNDEY